MRRGERNITVSAAICEAIGLEMERDERVVILGEDVGVYGGVFGATDGLQQRFGPRRVRDMPISEMAFTGMGVGLAMAGYRPLVEIMFVDFIGVCLEQIYNAMAKIPYMSGGNQRISMVIKTAGGCIGAAAQHSQCLWGTLAHLPGMQIVVPANPYMAKGLMISALRSEDPVIFVEHKALMRRNSDTFWNTCPVPEEAFTIPIGRAQIVREGKDLTVVTLAKNVEDALEAADKLDKTGIDIEVVDLVSVVPLDIETIAASVDRTGRLLVVDEDYLSFGLSGEVVARIVEYLGPKRSPQVRRLAVPDIPIPAALTLEQAAIPGKRAIEVAARDMVAVD